MSVRTRLLELSGTAYRVSLSDMVVVVDVVWTRLQQCVKNGVGGVNFGLVSVPARDEDSSRGPGTRCTPNKHQRLDADDNTATGARVEEARKGP
jgi:hypothetical protein